MGSSAICRDFIFLLGFVHPPLLDWASQLCHLCKEGILLILPATKIAKLEQKRDVCLQLIPFSLLVSRLHALRYYVPQDQNTCILWRYLHSESKEHCHTLPVCQHDLPDFPGFHPQISFYQQRGNLRYWRNVVLPGTHASLFPSQLINDELVAPSYWSNE